MTARSEAHWRIFANRCLAQLPRPRLRAGTIRAVGQRDSYGLLEWDRYALGAVNGFPRRSTVNPPVADDGRGRRRRRIALAAPNCMTSADPCASRPQPNCIRCQHPVDALAAGGRRAAAVPVRDVVPAARRPPAAAPSVVLTFFGFARRSAAVEGRHLMQRPQQISQAVFPERVPARRRP